MTPARACVGDLLAGLIDGELDHETRERVQSHLVGCATCRAERDAHAALKARLQAASLPQVSPMLTTRLLGLAGLDQPAEPAQLATTGRALSVRSRRQSSRRQPQLSQPQPSQPQPNQPQPSRRLRGQNRPSQRRPSRNQPTRRVDGVRLPLQLVLSAGLTVLAFSVALAVGAPRSSSPGVRLDPSDEVLVADYARVAADLPMAPAAPASRPSAQQISQSMLAGLGQSGWTVPAVLPGHLQLVQASMSHPGGAPVLHLAYFDGVSRLSLFAQAGGLGERQLAGFVHQPMSGADSWVRSTRPERVVWTGDGAVWTLLSDASPAVVRSVVGALPRDATPEVGPLARLDRGVARIGSWLNPFS